MEVKYAAAKEKAELVQDAKVKAMALEYAETLFTRIEKAKRDANFEKMRWSTSFALPTS